MEALNLKKEIFNLIYFSFQTNKICQCLWQANEKELGNVCL